MKKRIFYVIVLLILIAGAFVAYKFFGPATTTPSGEFFYIKTGATYVDVKNELVEQKE